MDNPRWQRLACVGVAASAAIFLTGSAGYWRIGAGARAVRYSGRRSDRRFLGGAVFGTPTLAALMACFDHFRPGWN